MVRQALTGGPAGGHRWSGGRLHKQTQPFPIYRLEAAHLSLEYMDIHRSALLRNLCGRMCACVCVSVWMYVCVVRCMSVCIICDYVSVCIMCGYVYMNVLYLVMCMSVCIMYGYAYECEYYVWLCVCV